MPSVLISDYDELISILAKNWTMSKKPYTLISNVPRGSPAKLWREEIKRHNLSKYIDVDVFCPDISRRKPAKEIFEFALKKLKHLQASRNLKTLSSN